MGNNTRYTATGRNVTFTKFYFQALISVHLVEFIKQWRIQDFPQGGAPTPKIAIIFHIFAENCMKMKEFGPPGGAHPWRPPLDPPMLSACHFS